MGSNRSANLIIDQKKVLSPFWYYRQKLDAMRMRLLLKFHFGSIKMLIKRLRHKTSIIFARAHDYPLATFADYL